MHVPLQLVSPALQLIPQTPATQVAVPLDGVGHTCPQLPQLLVSEPGLTHEPPQLVNPALQAIPHTPPEHVAVPLAVAGQA
jgi:hypothetical protein